MVRRKQTLLYMTLGVGVVMVMTFYSGRPVSRAPNHNRVVSSRNISQTRSKVDPPEVLESAFKEAVVPPELFLQEVDLNDDERKDMVNAGGIFVGGGDVNDKEITAEFRKVKLAPDAGNRHIGIGLKLNNMTYREIRCPHGFKPNRDNIDLEIVLHCGRKEILSVVPAELQVWAYREEAFCDAHIYGYNREFLMLRRVIIDGRFAIANEAGGSLMDLARAGKTDQGEIPIMKKGFFRIGCETSKPYYFRGGSENYLNKWYPSIISYKPHQPQFVNFVVKDPALAITRYEYANLYHMMAELYNCYLACSFFQIRPSEAAMVMIDGHPSTPLDTPWRDLFRSVTRLDKLRQPTFYKKLIWVKPGHESHFLDSSQQKLPLAADFVTYIMSRYRLQLQRKVNCKHLVVTFVLRRPYVSTLQNKEGDLDRQIHNDTLLLEKMKRQYPQHIISGYQLEQYSFSQQIKIIHGTDILVGMHGAGLTHALFLPPHAGMVELLPANWNRVSGQFEAIARWRGIKYHRWSNTNSSNVVTVKESKHPQTVVDKSVLVPFIDKLKKQMCPDE